MLHRSLIVLKGGETDWRHEAAQVCVGTVSEYVSGAREGSGKVGALDGVRSPWSTAQSNCPSGRIPGNGTEGEVVDGSSRCCS